MGNSDAINCVVYDIRNKEAAPRGKFIAMIRFYDLNVKS